MLYQLDSIKIAQSSLIGNFPLNFFFNKLAGNKAVLQQLGMSISRKLSDDDYLSINIIKNFLTCKQESIKQNSNTSVLQNSLVFIINNICNNFG